MGCTHGGQNHLAGILDLAARGIWLLFLTAAVIVTAIASAAGVAMPACLCILMLALSFLMNWTDCLDTLSNELGTIFFLECKNAVLRPFQGGF